MVLTYTQLNNSLLNVISHPTYVNALVQDYFQNLYSIGCRPTELTSSSRWSLSPSADYLLLPSKNNNARVIAPGLMTNYLKDQINAGAARIYPYSYEKFLYWFSLWHEFQPCFIGTKSVDLYLFRHRFVKGLALAGYSVPYITAYMGWINPDMADNYINSVITTP